jgi:membrane protein implicated in regulation of membrane protease activity
MDVKGRINMVVTWSLGILAIFACVFIILGCLWNSGDILSGPGISSLVQLGILFGLLALALYGWRAWLRRLRNPRGDL